MKLIELQKFLLDNVERLNDNFFLSLGDLKNEVWITTDKNNTKIDWSYIIGVYVKKHVNEDDEGIAFSASIKYSFELFWTVECNVCRSFGELLYREEFQFLRKEADSETEKNEEEKLKADVFVSINEALIVMVETLKRDYF